MCITFFVLLSVGRRYVNQNLLEGLWLGGGSNTVQYCLHSPHMQPGNEAAALIPSALSFLQSFLESTDFKLFLIQLRWKTSFDCHDK